MTVGNRVPVSMMVSDCLRIRIFEINEQRKSEMLKWVDRKASIKNVYLFASEC